LIISAVIESNSYSIESEQSRVLQANQPKQQELNLMCNEYYFFDKPMEG